MRAAMQRSRLSTERTPLVSPSYVYESSMTRTYQRRLRQFQCAICVIFVAVLSVAFLVTVSYSLADDTNSGNVTVVPPGVEEGSSESTPENPGNLTMMPHGLLPILSLSWPLMAKPLPHWTTDNPSSQTLEAAVNQGTKALESRSLLEASQTPLSSDTPAWRAQRAAATAALVKPLSDAGYAAEEATRFLVNGSDYAKHKGNVGRGPTTNGSWSQPAYCHDEARCPVTQYRSIDGLCNNLLHPTTWGVAYTPFRRALPPVYGDGISSPRNGMDGLPLPSARDVSVTVHRASYAHDSVFTVMMAVWGQFVDHDITATALSKGVNSTSLSCCDSSQPLHPECFPVRLDPEDPFYQKYNVTCMEFVRSASAPTCHFGPREQLNQATSYIDGSVVYGYTEERAKRLRSGNNGRLRMTKVGDRELLPAAMDPHDGCNTLEMNINGKYCFDTGDDRANENLHLTTMHLIWARQHNTLAAILQTLNPAWNDEQIYQEARKIVGAQIQHITYREFLPIVLGHDVMWALNLTTQTSRYSTMYDPDVDPSIANHFAAAAFRFAHTLLPGLIHHVDSNKNSVDYIHLHSMLFNPYQLYLERGSQTSVKSALDTPVHRVDPHVTDELSNRLFERPISNSSGITKPGPCGLDLVSLNIQRGRDHGLPPYPAWREHCGLGRPTNFEQLRGVFDEPSFGRISTIYRSVEEIDLYTGALAEDPKGRLLGPTLTCLIADQFLRLKLGDRFWYETEDASVGFTYEQLQEIRKTTLAGVICSNELHLGSVQPRVMQLVSGTNPLVHCTDIPQPDWRFWKDSS